jgi:fatty acid desaturase
MPATIPTPQRASLNSPDFLRRVNGLRHLNNLTNWFYVVREYLFLAIVIGATITFYEHRADWDLAWLWNAPVTLLAIALIGAGQHRLTTLGHEASHYMLFRNRKLNELASDLLCMFPMWSTTHHYRLQHLAHHQFPNDPERDPDVMQMDASGHRYQWPMSPRRFIWQCIVKQWLVLPKLIRYIRMRAKFSATGEGSGPYESKGPRSKLLVLVGVAYLASQAMLMTALVMLEQPVLLAVLPTGLLAAVLTFYAVVPNRLYRHSNLKPDVTPRVTTLARMSYLTGLFLALGWLSLLTGSPWGLYYGLLWVVPLLTTFSFYMLMRQIVQHGNATGDRFANTRVFLVALPIRWAVFPMGMDYHLPHHLFPLVPHYRLPELHALLLETEEYRQHGTVVEGYFFHRRPPQHATVLELMAQPPG